MKSSILSVVLVGIVAILGPPAVRAGSLLYQQATLQNVWDNQAHFVLDSNVTFPGFGSACPSIIQVGSEMWAYLHHQSGPDTTSDYSIYRVRSTDGGVSWGSEQPVLVRGGAPQWSWNAATLSHGTGRPAGTAWEALTNLHAAGHMIYGPYTTAFGGGTKTAVFKLMVDIVAASNSTVATVDAFDATTGTVLASRAIHRHDLLEPMRYREFFLQFPGVVGHQIELRVFWHDTSYVKVAYVGARNGGLRWDDEWVGFPGVYAYQGNYYLVYEGVGTSPGDVGLAVSSDGVNFTRSFTGPLLTHQGGWESTNIGTPTIMRRDGEWFVFYHGFDGGDVRFGVAIGSSLTPSGLARSPWNPIVNTVSGTWRSGTAGRRSRIFDVNGKFYCLFEASTDKPFDTASWTSGLARSNWLRRGWEVKPTPVLPSTGTGFGYDIPELFRSASGTTYVYTRLHSGQVVRFRAVMN